MSDIIFVQTRWDYRHGTTGYRSYQDYFRLAELSGYPIIYVDEMDMSDVSKCYIASPRNGEWPENGWPDAKARLLFWNLEQDVYPPLAGIAETWCSDTALARKGGYRYVPMGSHEGLKLNAHVNANGKPFDVIMLSYMTPRRNAILNGWYDQDNGDLWVDGLNQLGITQAPQGWDAARHEALMQSSAMLHVHQWDEKAYCAPQRWCLAAAYSLPLITETLEDVGRFVVGQDMLMSDMRNLPAFINMWVKRNDHIILENIGHALHQKLCHEMTFKRCVEANV